MQPEQSIPADRDLADATRETVMRYHLSWKHRDIDAVMALYHPEVEYNDFFQNRRMRLADLREYVEATMPKGPDESLEHTDRIRFDGDTAFIQYRLRVTLSGRLASFRASEAITVRDGLIWRISEYASLVHESGGGAQAGGDGRPPASRLGLSAKQLSLLARDLEHYFQQAQPYLDPDLDLTQVANATGYTAQPDFLPAQPGARPELLPVRQPDPPATPARPAFRRAARTGRRTGLRRRLQFAVGLLPLLPPAHRPVSARIPEAPVVAPLRFPSGPARTTGAQHLPTLAAFPFPLAMEPSMSAWRHLSLWMNQLDDPLEARPSLEESLEVDVAIVGAGYTGLWTAYYLKRRAPQLRVAIVEAETAGFGASGRNGGWLMGNLLGEDGLLAGLPPERRRAGYDLLHGIPDEVARVLQEEGIDCDYRKGGVLYCAARYLEQERRLRAYLHDLYAEGLDESDYRWLTPQELDQQLRIPGSYRAIHSPHCATIQPARLARGLARAVERLGVRLFEKSRVLHWQRGLLRTERGELRAEWIVPAVEGYAASLPPLGHYQLPVQSLLVATEPLPSSVWAEIGLERGQAFSEFSRQVTYGQRTADDRLAFGARGGYRFGGKLRSDFSLDDEEVGLRRYLFGELFPLLKDARISHTWGGNLGMARRFRPHMLLDRASGIALSGGYGGEGVGASNLGGRTLAALILGEDSELLRQPWVLGERPLDSLARWEPEPCRWLGYNAIIRSFVHEDRVLADPHSAPWRRSLAQTLAAGMESLMR